MKKRIYLDDVRTPIEKDHWVIVRSYDEFVEKINEIGFKSFTNIKNNIHLFINAYDLEDAMVQFDLCDFAFRKEWKVFLETGQQPS